MPTRALYSLFALLACATAAVQAQSLTVQTVEGVVLDENDAPLAGVGIHPLAEDTLCIADELGLAMAFSDAHGRYSIDIVEGRHRDLLFVHPGRVQLRQSLARAAAWPTRLSEARTLIGRIVDAKGAPVAGAIVTCQDALLTSAIRTDDERSGNPEPWLWAVARSDRDGRFVMHGVYPTALTLSVSAPGFERFGGGPFAFVDPIRIVLEPRENRGREPERANAVSHRQLRVRVTAPDGSPIDMFEAAAFEDSGSLRGARSDRQHFARFEAAKVEGRDGRVELTVHPAIDAGIEGLVLVRAPGFAWAAKRVASGTAEATVRLEPAVNVQGRLVDEAGQGIGGADVWVVPGEPREPHDGAALLHVVGLAATTAANGNFVLAAAPPGPGTICAHRPGIRIAPLRTVVGAGQQPVRLTAAPLDGPTLEVRMAGGPPPPRCQGIVLAEESARKTFPPRAGLEDAIAWTSPGIAPTPEILGTRIAELAVQRMPRQGRPDKLTLGTVELEGKDLTVDVEDMRPATVRGRVRGPVPFQRLAVVASFQRSAGSNTRFVQYAGPLCPLEPDGSFEVACPPGKRTLVVIDMETAVMFARGHPIDLRANEVRENINFDYEAHMLTVEVRWPEDADGDRFLEVLPEWNYWPGGLGYVCKDDSGGIDEWSRNMGLRLRRGVDRDTLWLPPCKCEFAVRTWRRGSSGRSESDPHHLGHLDPRKIPRLQVAW